MKKVCVQKGRRKRRNIKGGRGGICQCWAGLARRRIETTAPQAKKPSKNTSSLVTIFCEHYILPWALRMSWARSLTSPKPIPCNHTQNNNLEQFFLVLFFKVSLLSFFPLLFLFFSSLAHLCSDLNNVRIFLRRAVTFINNKGFVKLEPFAVCWSFSCLFAWFNANLSKLEKIFNLCFVEPA